MKICKIKEIERQGFVRFEKKDLHMLDFREIRYL